MRDRPARAACPLLLAACSSSSGNLDGECQTDADCGPEICARDSQCIEESQVREVRATWTIGGFPANPALCEDHGDLSITFLGTGPGERLSYAPVPCAVGTYFIDRLPRSYRWVELGFLAGSRELLGGELDRGGAVVIDLAP